MFAAIHAKVSEMLKPTHNMGGPIWNYYGSLMPREAVRATSGSRLPLEAARATSGLHWPRMQKQ